MKEILTIFKAYCGTGMYPFLFLAALLYLFVTEKEKKNRIILLETSAVIGVLFFFPPFKALMDVLDEGTYYRILWLLPMSVVIAWAGVRLIGKHRRIGIAAVIALLILSGDYVYDSVHITKAENRYHIPDAVVAICDRIHPAEGEERVTAVFPQELLYFVRQYDTDIQMPYGREVVEASWNLKTHPIYEVMEAEQINIGKLEKLATEALCQYIILNRAKPVSGVPEEFGLTKLEDVGGYSIYRNENVEIFKKAE